MNTMEQGDDYHRLVMSMCRGSKEDPETREVCLRALENALRELETLRIVNHRRQSGIPAADDFDAAVKASLVPLVRHDKQVRDALLETTCDSDKHLVLRVEGHALRLAAKDSSGRIIDMWGSVRCADIVKAAVEKGGE